MVEEIGVTNDPKAIGYYSGLVEGVFALAQFCTGSWGIFVRRRAVYVYLSAQCVSGAPSPTELVGAQS
jgi:hypothetical protein